MTSTCRFCRFSVSLSESDVSCRRFPPVPLFTPQYGAEGEIRSFWPTAAFESTCGEFVLKPASLREAKLVEPIE